MKEDFINELGNTISIETSKKEIEGVEGVYISIQGPASVSENHITHMEAKELHRQLSQLLEE